VHTLVPPFLLLLLLNTPVRAQGDPDAGRGLTRRWCTARPARRAQVSDGLGVPACPPGTGILDLAC
jgi:hypothetical protein